MISEGRYMAPVVVLGYEVRPKDLLLDRRAPDGRAFEVVSVTHEADVVIAVGVLGDRRDVCFFGRLSSQEILPWFQPLLPLLDGE